MSVCMYGYFVLFCGVGFNNAAVGCWLCGCLLISDYGCFCFELVGGFS